MLNYAEGGVHQKVIFELSDAFHDLPLLLYGQQFDAQLCLSILEDLQGRAGSLNYPYLEHFREVFFNPAEPPPPIDRDCSDG